MSDNPQNHDEIDDDSADKPSQAEGSEEQADQALADAGLDSDGTGGTDGTGQQTGGHD
jgi:hypothetical protein